MDWLTESRWPTLTAVKSDQWRQGAWAAALLPASLVCAGCAGGNDEVLRGGDAGVALGFDSGAVGAPDMGAGGAASPSDGGAPSVDAAAASGCASPTCMVSNTGCMEGNYYLYDHQWNCGADSGFTCGPETLYACSYDSWYVVSNQAAGNTAVLTFPSVQENFSSSDPPLVSSLSTLTSTFAETSPHVGDYEVAYDLWLNNQGNELMIWVDTFGQTPAGSRVATGVSLGGETYDVWLGSGGYIAFKAETDFTSGTVNLLQFLDYATQQTWLPPGSTLGQINLGIEICSTDGQPATWAFSDFSVTKN